MIRLCFAFGNVAAKNDEARQLLFQQRKFEDVLMTLLEIHYDKNVEFPDRQRDLLNFTCKPKNDLDTDTNAFNDDDVIIKIIRLLANISVSSEVGHQIAENEKLIAFLLSVLGNFFLYKI